MIFVYGGIASGKSAFAEDLALTFPYPKIYLATMRVRQEADMERVNKHLLLREGKGFSTIEQSKDFKDLNFDMYKASKSLILLENTSNLLNETLFEDYDFTNPKSIDENKIFHKVVKEIETLEKMCEELIIVSDDISCSMYEIEKYGYETQVFIRILDTLNRHLIKKADRAYDIKYGIGIKIDEEYIGFCQT